MLKSSAERLLRGYFGRYWHAWCVVLLALLFAPAVWYRDQVILDPPAFVAEWIKTGLTSFVIILVVEVVSHRRQRHERETRAREHIAIQFVAVLRRLSASIESLAAASPTNPGQTDFLRSDIRRDWQLFQAHATAELLSGAVSADVPADTLQSLQTAPYSRCGNAIQSALHATPTNAVNACKRAADELAHLISIFEAAVNADPT